MRTSQKRGVCNHEVDARNVKQGNQRLRTTETTRMTSRRTLYQCFLTLPSVRFGNVLAISLQLLPASRKVLSRCSSAGVHGVLVRPFFAAGLGSSGWEAGCPKPATSMPAALGTRPCGCPNALALLLADPGMSISEPRRLRGFTDWAEGGGGGCGCCCCCCCWSEP